MTSRWRSTRRVDSSFVISAVLPVADVEVADLRDPETLEIFVQVLDRNVDRRKVRYGLWFAVLENQLAINFNW